jgi:hypothetical protein
VRELYDSVAIPIDDGDETRACGHHGFLRIFWTPGCIKCKSRFFVGPNGKKLGEFFDTKRANRHHKASKKSLGIFSFLLVDS